MHLTPPPPRRVLVVAASVTHYPADKAGWRHIPDADIIKATGYSLRTVQLAWQEIADLGMADVGRATDGGVRPVQPLPHPFWAAVFTLTAAEVTS